MDDGTLVVLCMDLGLVTTGLCRVDLPPSWEIGCGLAPMLSWGVLELGNEEVPRGLRWQRFQHRFRNRIEVLRPDLVAWEVARFFRGGAATEAIVTLGGLAEMECEVAGVPFVWVKVSDWKIHLLGEGHGNADKAECLAGATDWIRSLGYREVIVWQDAADAIGVARWVLDHIDIRHPERGGS